MSVLFAALNWEALGTTGLEPFYFMPLFLGLVFAAALRIDPLRFSGICALLVGIEVLTFIYLDVFSIALTVALMGLAMMLATIVLSGIAGRKISRPNYNTILAMLTLFPWFAHYVPSTLFVLTFIVALVAVGNVKMKRACRQLGIAPTSSYARATSGLAKDKAERLKELAGVYYIVPALIAGVVAYGSFVFLMLA